MATKKDPQEIWQDEKLKERVSDRADELVGVCPYCKSPIRKTCECGANAACTKEGCGYGSGQYPCECRPAEPNGLKQVW